MRLSSIAFLLALLTACQGQTPLMVTEVTTPSFTDWSVRFIQTAEQKSRNAEQISPYIRRIYQDRKGNIWLGTNTDGLCLYDKERVRYFSRNNGLAGNAVRGIAEDPEGHLWVATDGGLSRFDGRNFKNYTTADGLPDADIWSILFDSKGKLWLGTRAGLVKFDTLQFHQVKVTELKTGTPSLVDPRLVMAIYEDRLGNIWLGMDGGGVRKYDGHSFQTFTVNDGLGDNIVTAIQEDGLGRLWFGTYSGGLSRYDGKGFTNFTTKDGLGSNAIWTIMKDHNGNLWFGSLGGGASRFDGNWFTNFSEKNGMTRNHVQSIFEDRQGRLWFGFSGGLFQLRGNLFYNITRPGC